MKRCFSLSVSIKNSPKTSGKEPVFTDSLTNNGALDQLMDK